MSVKVRICALLMLAMLAAACGGDGGNQAEGGLTPKASPTEEDTPSEEPTEEESPSEEESEVAEGAVTDVADVQAATIQIVAEGAFADPEFGEYEAGGAGSGFIVDPSGIAVTNNHVVTGSALLQVYVQGEDDPRNAKILGVSECNDLAVIDIDGDGFPYLEWYEGEVSPGLEVRSAGYPLGDPEFTLTQGIISKADSDEQTASSSVDHSYQHDAKINPGNSGGPLVSTETGQVVGVNYAGGDENDVNLAIAGDLAQEVVAQLSEGEDVESIGINGFMVDDGTGNLGLWVSSVASGSPADTTGIDGGDIITRLENVTLGEDGLLTKYCDIIRSRSADDVMKVEVLRYATEEILEGQINGDELVQSFSFAQELEGEATTDTGADAEAADYPDYTTVTDDSAAISVEIPSEWSDVNGAPYTDDEGRAVTDVRASSDLEAFTGGWETPGIIFSASSALAATQNEDSILDELKGALEGQCTYQGRSDYSDPAYTGKYDTFTECGGVGATYVVLAAVPPGREYLIRVQFQANADRDFAALDRVLASFVVIGSV